ncbi:hypothetical protein MPSI1_002804 [Malassezia psittaci]|uniref:Uncharacterized protein n=1 Tax=Malassezia psittaci TaxID=1821823 RepID=A0AAF0FGG6_9BASI|nr:hypothetical protein MPSI1_002804 [Malassezia psittaci]
MDIVSSDMFGVDLLPAPEPCNWYLAKLSVRQTGVPLHRSIPLQYAKLPLRLADTLFQWVGPSGPALHETIPMDLTFERVYLGVIPATAISMIPAALLGLLLGLVVWKAFYRIYTRLDQRPSQSAHAKSH